ncbi:MAG: DNA/RNA-binding protein AlbA [Candidatus Methanomethylicia archaeon]|jgi:DNA-binding protein|uniref:DNA/RNA-binding protein Alba n=1 Tax=Thermoproteota archaeon TaxID=2056631 RepID=A0A520KEP2_9CREN|nr:DNA/RNA-binding protein AlbA [Candidatus Methanomethylicia archaeon]MCQ5340736.1 DNA/RNA-binding protein AlbA [Candidatus Methanomethylicia archaeon]RZN55671.1 MAG: DNA/RNA-binding protein AlbA [Candidatus Verstraetearchaeota archaeon]TDA37822.1 MAG: RNA-binding protein [Candidatus Verstraetearchaeota archaeon]
MAEKETKQTLPRGVILVGKKPVMSYAMVALMQLRELGEITIKARGKAISVAVDVAQILAKRFLSGEVEIKDITIGTQTVGDPPRNVSTIEIKLAMKK